MKAQLLSPTTTKTEPIAETSPLTSPFLQLSSANREDSEDAGEEDIGEHEEHKERMDSIPSMFSSGSNQPEKSMNSYN